MKENFDRALQLVLVHEGGFSNHPDDPGGATMKGVTLETFRRHFGADKTVTDLRHITQEQLARVYRLAFLRGLRTFSTFGVGWTKRVADVRQKALNMAGGAPSAPELTDGSEAVIGLFLGGGGPKRRNTM